jgi:acyl-coenzyme A synthetase/AMP-(fatty) acid ligase
MEELQVQNFAAASFVALSLAAVILPAPVREHEIVAWCKDRIAAYEYPRVVEIIDAMPMTATGKILKRALKAAKGN